jgi:hypothetical protein
VVEPENHQSVRIRKDSLVEREALSCLIDALIYGDLLARSFANRVLESEE